MTAAGASPSLDPNSLARVPDPSTHVGAALSIGNSTLGSPKHANLRSVADVAGSAHRVGNARTRSAAEPAHILGFSRPSSSFADVITRMRRSLGNSPLGVFLHGYLDLKSTAPTSELELTTGHASPFPMPVPFRDDCEAPHPRGLRRGLYQRRLARHCANVLIGYFSYIELGCPRGCPFNASGPLSEVQRIAAENLEGEIVRFLRHDRGLSPSTFAGGRARLVGHLASLTYAAPGFKAPDLATTVALPVEPLRVALPHTAGTIDPAEFSQNHTVGLALTGRKRFACTTASGRRPYPGRAIHCPRSSSLTSFANSCDEEWESWLPLKICPLILPQDCPLLLDSFVCVTRNSKTD